jgi:membrane-anchored protein YejM (alkaline phosphatase superfamily)
LSILRAPARNLSERMKAKAVAPLPAREPWFRYGLILAAITALGTSSAALIRIRSGFPYPPLFDLFRALFFFEHGLFLAATLATLLYFLPHNHLPRFFQAAIYFIFYLGFLWILIWGLVHRAYGIELSFGSVIDLVTHWRSIGEVGFSVPEFVSILAVALAISAALTAISLAFGRRVGKRKRRCWFAGLLLAFVIVHVPVRAYCLYEINHNQPAVLAYDDCVALPLRSELLVPGLRNSRFAMPDLASTERTKKYFNALKTLRLPKLPRHPNILWLNVESFRFDAVSEQVMPHLWGYRDRFQIRLDREHWSGGNATQFGVFSMLTGLSGHHLASFQKLGIKAPFLQLLSANGYRLSGGKENYFGFNGLNELLPAEMRLPDIPRRNPAKEDRLTIEHYLQDRESRPAAVPTFDFIPFDATHWPYWFPPDSAKFQPAPLTHSSQHVLHSNEAIEEVRNRYRNACYFIDEQIGRLLDDLQAHNGFANTIVILVGDHGEEFQERGQLTHAAVLNDYQGRTLLWMHLPDLPPQEISIEAPTTHLDIVPTLLFSLGLTEDVLYTQGRSLFEPPQDRQMLALCENGFRVPLYRALVTDTFISRWSYRPRQYLFSGVERRDGAPVTGEGWLAEARSHLPEAAEMYEILPDTSLPPRQFTVR